MKSLAIKVKGRVQGVGFRYSTQQKARELNISGLVKNMMDGSVFIEASGTIENLDKFTSWCYQGPRWAYVDSVEISEIALKEYKGFNITR